MHTTDLNMTPDDRRDRDLDIDRDMADKPFVHACISGSMKLYEFMQVLAPKLTAQGFIVTMPFVKKDHSSKLVSEMLDKMHLQKIAECDRLYIVFKDGYIGPSTHAEQVYAESLDKLIIHVDVKDLAPSGLPVPFTEADFDRMFEWAQLAQNNHLILNRKWLENDQLLVYKIGKHASQL